MTLNLRSRGSQGEAVSSAEASTRTLLEAKSLMDDFGAALGAAFALG
jgi:hypothetical protein